MSEEWNNMNDTQRSPYSKLAEQDKSRYEREKKEYEKNKVPAVATPKATGKGKKSAKKDESEEDNE